MIGGFDDPKDPKKGAASPDKTARMIQDAYRKGEEAKKAEAELLRASVEQGVRDATEQIEKEKANIEAIRRQPIQERVKKAASAVYPYFTFVMKPYPQGNKARESAGIETASLEIANNEEEKLLVDNSKGYESEEKRAQKVEEMQETIIARVDALYMRLKDALAKKGHKPDGYVDIEAAWQTFQRGLRDSFEIYAFPPKKPKE